MGDLARDPEIRRRRAIWIGGGLMLAFALGFLAIAFATGWRDVVAAMGRLSAADVAVVLALSLANYALRAGRWRLYTRRLGIPTSAAQDALHYFGGLAFAATPGKVGELVRLWWIRRATGISYDRSGALIVGDRVADMAAMGILLAVTTAAASGYVLLALATAAVSLAFAALAMRETVARRVIGGAYGAFRIRPRLFAGLRRAARGLGLLSEPMVAVPAVALGCAGWLAEGLAFAWLLSAMGADVFWPVAVFVFCFSMLAGAASALPGGLGGAEAAMLALLTFEGVPIEIALPATAIIRAATLWFAVGLGILAAPFAARISERTT